MRDRQVTHLHMLVGENISVRNRSHEMNLCDSFFVSVLFVTGQIWLSLCYFQTAEPTAEGY
jgi:hypothetical protein